VAAVQPSLHTQVRCPVAFAFSPLVPCRGHVDEPCFEAPGKAPQKHGPSPAVLNPACIK